MLHLPNVTLYMYDTRSPKAGLAVLEHCTKLVKFGDCVFVTNTSVPGPAHIRVVQTDEAGLPGYNKHIMQRMGGNIATDFALVVQTDGFVLNPHKWRPEFFDYDYIGAPWGPSLQREFPDGTRVGNGGFSLRSKKLMDLTRTFTEYDPEVLTGYHQAEDFYICKTRYSDLMKHGIKIADVRTAANFSLEAHMPDHPRTYKDVFGFHGRFVTTRQFIEAVLGKEPEAAGG